MSVQTDPEIPMEEKEATMVDDASTVPKGEDMNDNNPSPRSDALFHIPYIEMVDSIASEKELSPHLSTNGFASQFIESNYEGCEEGI